MAVRSAAEERNSFHHGRPDHETILALEAVAAAGDNEAGIGSLR